MYNIRIYFSRLFSCSREHLFLVSSASSPRRPTCVRINFPRFFPRARHRPGRAPGNENTSANIDNDDDDDSVEAQPRREPGYAARFSGFHESRALLFHDSQQQFRFYSDPLGASSARREFMLPPRSLRCGPIVSFHFVSASPKCVLILGCSGNRMTAPRNSRERY